MLGCWPRSSSPTPSTRSSTSRRRKAVGESVGIPLEYYDINVTGTIQLLLAMRDAGVHRLVFSSSCSLYGAAQPHPLTEDDPLGPTNPYARTKFI